MSTQPAALAGATSRFLRPDERSEAPHMPTLPWVIEALPRHGSFGACVDLVTASRQAIVRGIEEWGAVLLRGFSILDAEAFSEVLASLGLELDTKFDLEPSQRRHSSSRSFNSSHDEPTDFLGPHTEMAYSNLRPRYISFHCEQRAAELGETPIMDFQAILREMDPEVRKRFETTPVLLRRWLTHDYLANKYRGDLSALKAALVRGGYTFTESDGEHCLAATYAMPAVIQHPATGEPTFNYPWYIASSWRKFFTLELIKIYPERCALGVTDRFRGPVVNTDPRMDYLDFPDGNPLTEAQTRALCRLTFGKSTFFPWIEGDVIVLDNARIGHSKSPHRGARKINAAIANLFDITRDRGA